MAARILKTNKGRFRLTENETLFSINDKEKCVKIKIETIHNPQICDLLFYGHLDGVYNLNNVYTNKHEHMLNLLLTYIMNKYPTIRTMKLVDDLEIYCQLPNSRIVAYPLTFYNLAFDQKTYFEEKYNAKMLHEEQSIRYETLISNFDKPKPKEFSFHNLELEQELQPLWNKTKTWTDFFTRIYKKYGKKRSAIVYPWIKYAIFSIFENFTIGQMWIIDTTTVPHIVYREYQERKQKLRLLKFSLMTFPHSTVDMLSYDDIYNLPYSKLLNAIP